MFAMLSAVMFLLAGCAAPPATAPAPRPLPAQLDRFGTERGTQARVASESRGWAYIGAYIRVNPGTDSGIEFLSFVDPASVARTGSSVRYRTLSLYAKPIGAVVSTVSFHVVDCQARTLQAVGSDGFSDEAATVRVSTTNAVGAAVPVGQNTAAHALLTSMCVGRFAGRTGTAAPPAPRGGIASGVAIAARTALTNSHVVASCKTIEVVADGRRLPATIRKQDRVNDLALLHVPDLPTMPYPIWRRSAQAGEAVMAAGYPLTGLLGSDVVVTDGIVNSLSGLGNSTSHLQISAAVQAGNSGGPLLDRGGQVVGIVVAKLNALASLALTGDLAQNVNFAIKPEIVALFLQSENLPLRLADAAGTLDTQQVAARARTFTLKVECKV